MPRISYTAEFRAALVAEVLAGTSALVVAAQHGVDRQTVARWTRNGGMPSQRERVGPAQAGLIASVMPQEIGQRASVNRLPSLLAAYIEQGIVTLTEQLRVTGTEDYIRSQNAHDLAIMHGVAADKLLRVLAALRPVEQEPEPDPR